MRSFVLGLPAHPVEAEVQDSALPKEEAAAFWFRTKAKKERPCRSGPRQAWSDLFLSASRCPDTRLPTRDVPMGSREPEATATSTCAQGAGGKWFSHKDSHSEGDGQREETEGKKVLRCTVGRWAFVGWGVFLLSVLQE